MVRSRSQLYHKTPNKFFWSWVHPLPRYDPLKLCLYEIYHQDRVNGCSIPTCLFKMVQNPGEELYSKLESIKSPSHTRGLTISKEKKMAPPLVFRTKTQMQLHELALILSFIDRFTLNTHNLTLKTLLTGRCMKRQISFVIESDTFVFRYTHECDQMNAIFVNKNMEKITKAYGNLSEL